MISVMELLRYFKAMYNKRLCYITKVDHIAMVEVMLYLSNVINIRNALGIISVS